MAARAEAVEVSKAEGQTADLPVAGMMATAGMVVVVPEVARWAEVPEAEVVTVVAMWVVEVMLEASTEALVVPVVAMAV